jgi:hypothetical protein
MDGSNKGDLEKGNDGKQKDTSFQHCLKSGGCNAKDD